MYLKVEIDGEEKLYSFPEKKIVTIGRSPDSDIQLLVEGISRNHSKVINKEDEFFYVDVGSSRGSYLNEEKISPNTATQFNSFFPIKLGESVSLFLVDELSKEELEQTVQSEENQIDINEAVKSQKKEKAEDLKQKHKPMIYVPESSGTVTADASKILKKSSKTNNKKKPRNKKMPIKNRRKQVDHTHRLLMILLGLVIVGFFGYQKYEKNRLKELEQMVQFEKERLATIAAEKARLEQIEKEKAIALEKNKLAKAEQYLKQTINEDKCLIDLEIALCNLLKSFRARDFKEGAIKKLSTIYLILDLNSLDDLLVSRYSGDYEKSLESTVIDFAKLEMGRNFHRGFFVNNLKLRVGDLDKSAKFYQSLLLIDFLKSNLLEKVLGEPKIEEVVLVGYQDFEYSSYIRFKTSKLKSFSVPENLDFYIQLIYRSHILKPFEKLKNSITY